MNTEKMTEKGDETRIIANRVLKQYFPFFASMPKQPHGKYENFLKLIKLFPVLIVVLCF